MDAVISLTNKKKIPMGLPNGQGGQINLDPGETRYVRGDFEHYRRMPKQGMNGLVVKLVDGKSRLVEAEKKVDDVRLVTVTNHRNIPMQLSTGIGQAHANIGAKETSEPFLARIRTIKQMSGITVHIVEEKDKDEAAPPADDETTDDEETKPEVEVGADEAAPPADDETTEVEVEVEADGDLENTASAEAEAIAKQAAADEAAAKKEAEANDPLVKRRRDLTLPATREEWDIHSKQMTWPDVRGICKELGIKAGSKNKKQLLKAITKELYPKS